MTFLIHDDPILAARRAELQAGFDAAAEQRRITGKTAMQRAMEEIDAKAKKLRRELVDRAARQYCADPRLLDKIKLGLSDAHPAFIMAAIEQMRRIPWGRTDMLGVLSINEAGAYTYARWLRLAMRREAAAAQEVAYA